MKIIGIVGWKNSGKTYFAQKIIAKLSALNLNVGSIKHAHHNFDIDRSNTDSFLHRKAGSQQIIVSSSKRWAKITELSPNSEKNLNELIGEFKNIDVLVVEGYKNENHLKIEIIKDPLDPSSYMFNKLNNIIAIISDTNIKSFTKKQFEKNQIDEIVNFILSLK